MKKVGDGEVDRLNGEEEPVFLFQCRLQRVQIDINEPSPCFRFRR